MRFQARENIKLSQNISDAPIRHLIFLIDGTGMSASCKNAIDRQSNVYKLSLYLDPRSEAGESQIVFYLPGIGSKTSGLPIINSIFAKQLPLDVEKVYINICTNYIWSENENERDKIYIFGFSRGAVVARLVTALIGKYGVLRSSQIEMFPRIWNDFVNYRKINDLNGFKEDYCHCLEEINIEFLGLFDTVYGNYQGKNSAGLKKIFFDDRILGTHVKATTHLLALHETRALFRPVLFQKKRDPNQILEQIWMPGVHTDIGGGYSDDFLSNISLITMLDKVLENTFLEIDFKKSRNLLRLIADQLNQNRFTINNDCDLWLWKSVALFSKGNRILDNKDECQLIHPIFKILNGRSFLNKKTKSLDDFNSPNFPFSEAIVTSLRNLEN
ncbi:T6SS phospholipase effector Tle1-like catalytic domain-containing protein [Crenothrix sp.]|uniref:T6SS phospholipase effector Tle1-like catalytic domain-containing protein n=1 Tax=Crenothrix sp. TaxID=3100433 RepID=UPI00374CDFA1